MTTSFVWPTDAVGAVLGEAHLDALAIDGWCVVDGFAGAAEALAARAAAERLDAHEALEPAGVGRGAEHRLDATVRGDRITWLRDHPDEPALTRARARFERLRDEINRAAYLGLTEVGLQLAVYPGDGAHYARHRDAFPGSINRKVTAIWYLNPGWQPSDGGALRLYVPGRPVVEPVLDRLVVFMSELVEHAVEPAYAPRWAMTGWMRKADPLRPAL